MKYYLAVALACSVSLANAGELKVANLEKINDLPCSMFSSERHISSFRNGVPLELPISATNNTELFKRLAARANRCKDEASTH